MSGRAVAGFLRRVRGADELGVAGALLALVIALSLATDSFLRTGNLLDVARQASDFGIMAVGMVFLLAMGEIDLSVGAQLTLVNIVSALVIERGWGVPAAVTAGIATGALCGFCNGALSLVLRVPTIIVTLGTMSVYRGLALVLSGGKPVSDFAKDSAFFTVGGGDLLGGVPTGVVIMLVACALGWMSFERTAFGWRLQAIGSNVQAARFAGISVARHRLLAMTLMGTIAGVAGVTALAFLQAADPNVGLGSELLVIASAVIGGTPLSGGSGSIPGAVLGALTIAVIRNGLVHLGMSAYWGTAATGGIIIAAVAIGALIKKKGEARR